MKGPLVKNLVKSLLGLAAAASTAAALSATPAAAQSATQALTSESVIETIKKDGVVRVGLSLFTPWAMRDVNGDLIGFEIDVAQKLADDMGVDLELIPTAWDGIIPALVAGKFDVIISGMSVTTPRNLTVNFTDAYAYSGAMLYANKDLAGGFGMEEFNSADTTLVTLRGSIGETAARVNFPNAKIVLLDDPSAAFQEVLNGNAEGGFASETESAALARDYPETIEVPFEDMFIPLPSAFAIRKGDVDALNVFNNWIAVNTANGWLQERHDYWFTTEDWAGQVPE